MRNDPSLIALDLLRGMAALELLQDVDIPQIQEEWTESNSGRAALFTYGELAWVARGIGPHALQDPLWAAKGLEIGCITVPALLQMRAGQPGDMPAPPDVAIAAAIRATDTAQLVQIPGRWLSGTDLVERLLRRLDKDQALAYLARTAADFGIDLADRKRQALLGSVFNLGMGNAIAGMVEQWFTDPSERVDMIHGLLRREAIPAFHAAMLKDDAISAVRAWYDPLRESALPALAAPRLAELLDHKDQGSSAFAWAVSQGRAVAVQAFFLLLKDILTDRATQWHMKSALPKLLLTADSLHKPAVLYAMGMGYTPALKAFYAGVLDLLRDPALDGPIREPLLEVLPSLLAGQLGAYDSGLSYALQGGRTEVIEVLHDVLTDLLNDASIGTYLHASLPDMLAARTLQGETGVSIARKRGHRAALAAFSALLADPAIQPHIGQALLDELGAGPGVP